MADGLNEASPPGVLFKVHPSLQDFLVSPPVFTARHFAHGSSSLASGARNPDPTFLATGAIVFNRQLSPARDGALAPPPRVLLIQRAPHDSMPLLWETPGGGCDDDDTTILHACARELKEEAGLEATSVGPLVRCPATSVEVTTEDGPGKERFKTAERMGCHLFFTRKRKLVYKFYFILEVKQTTEVVLDPAEHVAYLWATEEEVRNERMEGESGNDGIELKFTTEEQRRVILEAFKYWGKDTDGSQTVAYT
ncbi:NUDIX hydrolase domain-like protein [Xylaria sp. FL1777]|nr:NUDIX hydrolase domain-like protein [Xylaria sp. FL1777]